MSNQISATNGDLATLGYVQEPFLSVCIPVLNGENFIAEAIASVLQLTSTEWELCISDNCSDDATERICMDFVQRDPRIRFSRASKRCGAAENWARASSMARGSWFIMLGHDDLLEPESMEALQGLTETHPQNRIVIAAPQVIDPEGKPFTSNRGVLMKYSVVTSLLQSAFLDHLVEGMVCAPTGMFFHRSLLSDYGTFDSNFRGCYDYEFLLRVAASGGVTIAPKALAKYRIHPSQDVNSYNLDRGNDPEKLQEKMLTFSHLSEAHKRGLMANMTKTLCDGVKLRYFSERYSLDEVLQSRRNAELRITQWKANAKKAELIPKNLPLTLASRMIWEATNIRLMARLMRPLMRAFKARIKGT